MNILNSLRSKRSKRFGPKLTKRQLFQQALADSSNIVHEPYEFQERVPDKVTEGEKLLAQFKALYDLPGENLKFGKINPRPNATLTCPFGLENGYKIVDGMMKWGYVRIHQGIDQVQADDKTYSWGDIPDAVLAPIDGDRSALIDYGDTLYGTLSRIYADTFGFEFRIAHINPNVKTRKANEAGPYNPWTLKQFKKGLPITRDWAMGSAGSYGNSSGAHTHIEVKSLGETCEMIDALLKEKFADSEIAFTSQQVISAYKRQHHFKTATDAAILEDYSKLTSSKKVIFLNRYKCRYVDFDGTIKTRYNPILAFNV